MNDRGRMRPAAASASSGSRASLPLLVLALGLAVAVPATAGAQDPVLLQRDSAWNALRLRGDAVALGALLADDWLLTHSDGRTQDKADYLRELARGARTNAGIVNEGIAVRVYGETAVITGTSVQSGVSDGVPWRGRFRFTRVWVRRDGVWVMVASHSSRVAE
jgi:hypothetical protein